MAKPSKSLARILPETLGQLFLGEKEFHLTWVEVIRDEEGRIIGVQGVSPENLETLDILADQEFSRRLFASAQQSREGKTTPSVEVRKRLGLMEGT